MRNISKNSVICVCIFQPTDFKKQFQYSPFVSKENSQKGQERKHVSILYPNTHVIQEFKNIGLDTAKSVLDASVEELLKRTDLEEETILDVQRILKEEFEE